jgi:hypothetical protein
LQNLSQFSLGNNDLDANASNRGACLLRDKCVPSTQHYRPPWN